MVRPVRFRGSMNLKNGFPTGGLNEIFTLRCATIVTSTGSVRAPKVLYIHHVHSSAQEIPGASAPGTPDQGALSSKRPLEPRAAPAVPPCLRAQGPLVNSPGRTHIGLCKKMPGSNSTSGQTLGPQAVADGGGEKQDTIIWIFMCVLQPRSGVPM